MEKHNEKPLRNTKKINKKYNIKKEITKYFLVTFFLCSKVTYAENIEINTAKILIAKKNNKAENHKKCFNKILKQYGIDEDQFFNKQEKRRAYLSKVRYLKEEHNNRTVDVMECKSLYIEKEINKRNIEHIGKYREHTKIYMSIESKPELPFFKFMTVKNTENRIVHKGSDDHGFLKKIKHELQERKIPISFYNPKEINEKMEKQVDFLKAIAKSNKEIEEIAPLIRKISKTTNENNIFLHVEHDENRQEWSFYISIYNGYTTQDKMLQSTDSAKNKKELAKAIIKEIVEYNKSKFQYVREKKHEPNEDAENSFFIEIQNENKEEHIYYRIKQITNELEKNKFIDKASINSFKKNAALIKLKIKAAYQTDVVKKLLKEKLNAKANSINKLHFNLEKLPTNQHKVPIYEFKN